MILDCSADNDKISSLNDKISSLQSEVNALQTIFYAKGFRTFQTSDAAIPKPRRTRSDPEKFSGAQKDTEKRQTCMSAGRLKYNSVIDKQVNLPNADDYAGWSEMINSIARNLQQQEHIARLQTPPIITRPSDSHVIPTAPDLEDPMPMDLSRMKLSASERTYRLENGLCVTCGEKGHISKDHHRKIDPIPMPKRHNNQPTPRGDDNRYRVPMTNRNNPPSPRNILLIYSTPANPHGILSITVPPSTIATKLSTLLFSSSTSGTTSRNG
ncbi:hypothetical protein EV44_g3686 [Erysiphe necator]|uniref:CCHC-type domain-containing protein n=1 Tax=Uncinula necator TaxID=52586 RepID=A0A0B1P6X7_UNCNE|nr:hypothetical protein EV44_g3686 [Erysiphe necator]